MAFDGSKWPPPSEPAPRPCKACEGRGFTTIWQFRCLGGVRPVRGHPCLKCDGTGREKPDA